MTELVVEVPTVALAIYAHPDDAEVSCGGTLALWARSGCQVHLLVATSGDKGTSDPAVDPVRLVRGREAEMASASDVLGISSRILLGIPDGELENSASVRAEVVRVVRELRPQAVLCPDPTSVFFGQEYVNHRDHRTIGWVALDAVAPAAALPHYFPDAGPPHQVHVVYLSGTLDADVAIDISATLEAKIAALACHRSQVGMSAEWVEELVRQRAADAGADTHVGAAETFRRQRIAP